MLLLIRVKPRGRAALTNASANASYLKQLGGYYELALTTGQRMSINYATLLY